MVVKNTWDTKARTKIWVTSQTSFHGPVVSFSDSRNTKCAQPQNLPRRRSISPSPSTTMFGAFKTTSPLSGGLLWYGPLQSIRPSMKFSINPRLQRPFSPSITTIVLQKLIIHAHGLVGISGRPPGDSPPLKSAGTASGSASWITSSLSLTRHSSATGWAPFRIWSGGRRRCHGRRRCDRKINIPCLIERRRPIERAFTVSLENMILV